MPCLDKWITLSKSSWLDAFQRTLTLWLGTLDKQYQSQDDQCLIGTKTYRDIFLEFCKLPRCIWDGFPIYFLCSITQNCSGLCFNYRSGRVFSSCFDTSSVFSVLFQMSLSQSPDENINFLASNFEDSECAIVTSIFYFISLFCLSIDYSLVWSLFS